MIGTETIDALGHDEGVWTATVAATCIADGEEVCNCTRCGEKIGSRAVAATGHDNGVWKIDFEATPDHNGQKTLYCTKCGATLDQTEIIYVHDHIEGYRETLTPATCMTNGEGGVFCAKCGAQFDTYVIPALGHDYTAWYTNNDGTHSKSCSRCHDLQTETAPTPW